MSSLYGTAAPIEQRQRLLKALAVSLVFHTLLLLAMAGVSLQYQPENRIGPMEVTFEVEPPPPVPDPEPVSSVKTRTDTPVAAPAAAPAALTSTRPARTAPKVQVPAPAPVRAESPLVSNAYAGLFDAPATAPAPGRSGAALTAPEETVTAPEQKREAGVIGSGTLVQAEKPVQPGTSSARETSNLNLSALDKALSALDGKDSGVVMVRGSGNQVSASVPGNAAENQNQITFDDGGNRKLLHSEPFDIPPSVKSFGQPDFFIHVYFKVDSNGFLQDLKITPPSGIPVLEAAIINSMRNWRFTRSQTTGTVGAQVQFLIKVK